jgi:hypothetical protein
MARAPSPLASSPQGNSEAGHSLPDGLDHDFFDPVCWIDEAPNQPQEAVLLSAAELTHDLAGVASTGRAGSINQLNRLLRISCPAWHRLAPAFLHKSDRENFVAEARKNT